MQRSLVQFWQVALFLPGHCLFLRRYHISLKLGWFHGEVLNIEAPHISPNHQTSVNDCRYHLLLLLPHPYTDYGFHGCHICNSIWMAASNPTPTECIPLQWEQGFSSNELTFMDAYFRCLGIDFPVTIFHLCSGWLFKKWTEGLLCEIVAYVLLIWVQRGIYDIGVFDLRLFRECNSWIEHDWNVEPRGTLYAYNGTSILHDVGFWMPYSNQINWFWAGD